MRRFLLMLLALPTFGFSQPLQTQCNNILGVVNAVPSGTFICNPLPLNPGISNVNETPITRCFSYQYLGPVRLSYLLVSGQCGPFPLYNQLSFSLYNATCDTLIVSGTIIPTQLNTFINYLTVGNWYIICYTWIPNCPQTAACPLLYTSLLPVELLTFTAEVDNDDVTIKWATASQLQVDRLVVTKSYDNIHWEEVVSYPGEGTTNSTNYYRYNYTEPYKGIVYYRLSELTFDGQVNAISVIAVDKSYVYGKEKYYDMLGRETEPDAGGIYIVKYGNQYKLLYK